VNWKSEARVTRSTSSLSELLPTLVSGKNFMFSLSALAVKFSFLWFSRFVKKKKSAKSIYKQAKDEMEMEAVRCDELHRDP
jgi:hypothetical protein